MKRLLFIWLVLMSAGCSAQIITTFAGNGTYTSTGDGGQATAAGLMLPCKGAFDKYGNFYIGEGPSGRKVRKIAPDGTISTFAGITTVGPLGDGGPATAARFKNAQAIAVDSIGNVFIADNYDSRIRKVDISTGIITTIAGDGTYGYSGDGGPATAAKFYDILDICFSSTGELYIAEYVNMRVRKINLMGIVTTVAGKGIGGYGGDGGLADTTSIKAASGLCFDQEGNLYIADWYSRVMKVTPAGIITTVAGNNIAGSIGDGSPATIAQICPYKVAIDFAGNLYIAEYNYDKVRKVNPSGIITAFAGNGVGAYSGDGGPATAAELDKASGLAFDTCDNVYISCAGNNRVRKVTVYPVCANPAMLGVNAAKAAREISIYPNPTSFLLHIENIQPNTTYQLLNLVGATVLQGSLKEGNNTISIQHLPPGVYVLCITDAAGGKVVRRVVRE